MALALLLITGCENGGAPGTPGGTIDDPQPPEASETLRVCPNGCEHATIGSAIAVAKVDAVIDIAAGTYRENVLIDGKALRLRGAGADSVILDGGAAGAGITVRNAGGNGVFLEGMTVRNGAAAVEGGGVRCEQSTLRIDRFTVKDNQAQGGGGLYALSCALTVRTTRFEHNEGFALSGGAVLIYEGSGSILDSVFTTNHADEGGAVALYGNGFVVKSSEFRNNRGLHGGAFLLAGDVTVEGNVIANNVADWDAGGIFINEHSPLVKGNTISGNTAGEEAGGVYVHHATAMIVGNTFTENQAADDGGGLRVFESHAHVEGNTFERNTAGDAGGGIKVSHVSSVLIDNIIKDNVAGGLGGGIELDNDGSELRGGVISGNQAWIGGGIHGAEWWQDTRLIADVRVEGNRATRGGGIHLENNTISARLRNVTVINNTAEVGGGLSLLGTQFSLEHSVFAGNTATPNGGGGLLIETSPGTVDFVVVYGNHAPYGSALYTNESGLTFQNSIIHANDNTAVNVGDGALPRWRYNDTLPATFSGMLPDANGNMAVDPMFVDPANGDFHLLPGSPCREAGDPDMRDDDGSRADMGRFGGPNGTVL